MPSQPVDRRLSEKEPQAAANRATDQLGRDVILRYVARRKPELRELDRDGQSEAHRDRDRSQGPCDVARTIDSDYREAEEPDRHEKEDARDPVRSRFDFDV